VYASLYLCCIRVGVHIAVAHRGDIAKSSKNLVAKSVSCIQFSLSRQLHGPSAFPAWRVCGCGSRNLGHFTVIIYEVHFSASWDFETLYHKRSAHGKPQVGKSKISRF
jgi:hypothetical protein